MHLPQNSPNNESDDGASLQVPVNDKQAAYLQRLGLKTLLTDKFKPTAALVWAQIVKRRFSILLIFTLGLGGYLLVLSAWKDSTEVALEFKAGEISELRQNMAKFRRHHKKWHTDTQAVAASNRAEIAELRTAISSGEFEPQSLVSQPPTPEPEQKKKERLEHVYAARAFKIMLASTPANILNRPNKVTGETLAHKLVKAGSGKNSLLEFAGAGGRLDVRRYRVATKEGKGWQPGTKGDTPLTMAIRMGNTKAVKMLCRVFKPEQLAMFEPNGEGQTALDILAASNSFDKRDGQELSEMFTALAGNNLAPLAP